MRIVLWRLFCEYIDNSETGLFYQDSYEMSETNKANITAGTTRNKGAKARWDKTKFSRSFEVMGTIHSEIFQQNKLIPSKVGIYLKFHRADPSCALMAADRNQKYKIQIEKATLIANIKKIASHVCVKELHMKPDCFKQMRGPLLEE